MPKDLRIIMDKADPVTGPVQLSIQPDFIGAGVTVRWMVDYDQAQSIGTGSSVSWNGFQAAGPHDLGADRHRPASS